MENAHKNHTNKTKNQQPDKTYLKKENTTAIICEHI